MSLIEKYLYYLKNSLYSNYFSIKGRASVYEYRIFISYVLLIVIIPLLIEETIFDFMYEENIFDQNISLWLSYIFLIAIPLITITIRRLHDLNLPTASIFLVFMVQAFELPNLESVGDIAVVTSLCFIKGKIENNKFGEVFK